MKDVVDYLKDLHHIEIQIDTSALKEAGVDEWTQVTKNLKGISLRSALKLVLDEVQLKYVVHHGVLLITSTAKAESDEFMQTRCYPVEDLVLPEDDGCVNFTSLDELLTATVATKSWTDNGGTGTLFGFVAGNRPLLVVSQSEEVHEQIENMLEKLRKAGGLKTAAQARRRRRQGRPEEFQRCQSAGEGHAPQATPGRLPRCFWRRDGDGTQGNEGRRGAQRKPPEADRFLEFADRGDGELARPDK